jgi:hypothetical protein
MSLDAVNLGLIAPRKVLATFSGEPLIDGIEHLGARQVARVDGGTTNPGLDERVAVVIERVVVERTVACFTGVSRNSRRG